MRAALLLLGACGDQLVPPDAALVPAPYQQPRVVTVGTAETVQYDAAGFPVDITALYSHYLLTWAPAPRLQRAEIHFVTNTVENTVVSVPSYGDDGLLASVDSTCTGGCPFQHRTDALVYDHGRLVDWSTSGVATRHHTFDSNGRVVAINGDTIEYRGGLCPTVVREGPFTSVPGYDERGRLIADQSTPIVYAGPWITRFEGTGPGFDDITYEPGEAYGLDLWPGHFNGGPVYGFPVRGELWRLDGSCDPTLTSQATITTLVLTAIFRSSIFGPMSDKANAPHQ